MAFSPSRLFHAVVVSGAALGACEKSSRLEPALTRPTNGPSAIALPSASPPPPSVPPVATEPPAKDAAAPAKSSAKSPCPPNSELPFPPCFYIR